MAPKLEMKRILGRKARLDYEDVNIPDPGSFNQNTTSEAGVPQKLVYFENSIPEPEFRSFELLREREDVSSSQEHQGFSKVRAVTSKSENSTFDNSRRGAPAQGGAHEAAENPKNIQTRAAIETQIQTTGTWRGLETSIFSQSIESLEISEKPKIEPENQVSQVFSKVESAIPVREETIASAPAMTTPETTTQEFKGSITASETSLIIKEQPKVTRIHTPDSDSSADESYSSDDSAVAREITKRKQAKAIQVIDDCKLALGTALAKKDWQHANGLAERLMALLEERCEKLPDEWRMDIAKLALKAHCLPKPDIVAYVSNIGKALNQSVSAKLQIEALFFEGVIYIKAQKHKKAIKSFQRGHKLARKSSFFDQANDFVDMLLSLYEITNQLEEIAVYKPLMPENHQPTHLMLMDLQNLTKQSLEDSVLAQRSLQKLKNLYEAKELKADRTLEQDCQKIFALLTVARVSLSVKTVSILCLLPEARTLRLVGLCRGIIITVTPIHELPNSLIVFQNPYFPKIFTEPSIGGSFFLGTKTEIHKRLAIRLLGSMERSLTEDICNIRAYGTRSENISETMVAEAIPESLQYACKNWLFHLQRGQISLIDSNELRDFFLDHSVHWVEVMGILKCTDSALSIVRELKVLTTSPWKLTQHKARAWLTLYLFI
ncbi:hypothetical protein TWF694_001355 [Orbilia ellipsospora]|uniref:Uncharacterized protein n=1 Tax=Orbilia ellipsospora TaxID=2528407 RepID=A0AAV9XRD0_9PEZI